MYFYYRLIVLYYSTFGLEPSIYINLKIFFKINVSEEKISVFCSINFIFKFYSKIVESYYLKVLIIEL